VLPRIAINSRRQVAVLRGRILENDLPLSQRRYAAAHVSDGSFSTHLAEFGARPTSALPPESRHLRGWRRLAFRPAKGGGL
jgi:hypothetical protein